jgi:aryl-alcohol dehydrogenase-like predicted oxidoreductase
VGGKDATVRVQTQSEYSPWTRDPEPTVLPLLRELRIGFVPYPPLGHGFLTGTIRSTEQFDANDFRAIDKLNKLTPPAGEHHNEQQMQMIDR